MCPEMKENNNSVLRTSYDAWALIYSSSDLPRSDCTANICFNGVISKDLLEQERKMEITIDETVSYITSTKDYDNDNGNNNDDNDDDDDDESKRKYQIPGISTSPSSITDILVDNGLTQLGSYKVPPQLPPSTNDPPGGDLLMNLNPSVINTVVPSAEGSASWKQGKKLEQIDSNINIHQLFEIDPSEFGVDSLLYIKNIWAIYLKLCLVQHPNRHINFNDIKTTNANFCIIKEAYDILLDPVKCQ